MKKLTPLDYKCFRRKQKISQLGFETTDELQVQSEFVGQERAVEALNFGVGIKSQGYNLYAMGPSGIGKLSVVTILLQQHANEKPIPNDWCYIYNFQIPEKPIALSLPAGQGQVLQQEMRLLIEEVGTHILSVFESDEYNSGMKVINDEFEAKRKKLSRSSKTDNYSLKGKIPHLYKERHEREKKLQLKLTTAVVEPLLNKVKTKFSDNAEVLQYLNEVQQDIITYVNEFIKNDEKTDMLVTSLDNLALIKYKVNLFVDNSQLKSAPVIFEETPTYSNLICRVEHMSQMGNLITNFTLIRPGSLHRANGGYLIVEMRKLKKNTEAWEALKSALYQNQIKIDPIQNVVDSVRPVSLEPMPIPLDVKVVLLGDRNTYYNLSHKDPDFSELFRVPLDFDEQIDRDKKNIKLYAGLIGTIAKREKLRPFHASAVAEIIDYSSRLAEDVEKLSTYIGSIEEIIVESDYWAGLDNKKTVKAEDVKTAINAQIRRMDRAKELYHEDIDRNFIIIKTKGKAIGQINCLSVRRVGNFSYGHPTRVSARVRIGNGKFVDIQREIKMAGPMHSKAGLIISNFLVSRFNRDPSVSLSASLAFEQVYCWTDGDSASVGELCALLSSLAEVPLEQSLAITGSIDQYGEVQAIGGVNEKIEGFFDVCKAKGLTGQQGVIIPRVNIKNLMLREDIVEAAKHKQFAIYPIDTVDEAVELLTGMSPGKRNAQGEFTPNSFYALIEKKLKKYSRHK